eukprot:GHVU01069487.1.p1 GENE.GHVU01069487.1~~GHVU01069487.1.p1  ORF type:complete len:271 (+),score=39.50 GHVU01069487.1:163-975(+)
MGLLPITTVLFLASFDGSHRGHHAPSRLHQGGGSPVVRLQWPWRTPVAVGRGPCRSTFACWAQGGRRCGADKSYRYPPRCPYRRTALPAVRDPPKESSDGFLRPVSGDRSPDGSSCGEGRGTPGPSAANQDAVTTMADAERKLRRRVRSAKTVQAVLRLVLPLPSFSALHPSAAQGTADPSVKLLAVRRVQELLLNPTGPQDRPEARSGRFHLAAAALDEMDNLHHRSGERRVRGGGGGGGGGTREGGGGGTREGGGGSRRVEHGERVFF